MVDFDVKVPRDVHHHVVNVLDQDDANLLDSLEDAVDFIEEAVDGDGKVLVHCVSGVSRSAAVVVAFMCHSMGLSVGEALEVLKMSSPQVCPNDGFLRQLTLFEEMGCGTKTAPCYSHRASSNRAKFKYTLPNPVSMQV